MPISSTEKKIKCVVWDLDNTLWHGTLLEGDEVKLNTNMIDKIKCLDSRGILHSIASRNEYDLAMAKLKNFGIANYFLYPQINWNAKHISIKTIAKSLNLGINTFAFIDDQPFELDEVKHHLNQILCIHVNDTNSLVDKPELKPLFITEDSKLRRKMYLNDIKRQRIQESFIGPEQEFLASLNMKFTISLATEDALQRAEELTVRTNQLNTTGYTYSYEELNAFRSSDKHLLLIASLQDKYGSYGKIGLALIEKKTTVWVVKLLLMSCRVVSRGVGNILINHILQLAKQNHVNLQAQFVPTDRNRMMYMTYKFAGFREVKTKNNLIILEHDLMNIQRKPNYVEVIVENEP